MSHPLAKEDVLFRQRILSCSGVYQRKLDGLWGQFTDEADRDFFARCEDIANQTQGFDERSERNIRTLRLNAQKLCRQSLAAIRASGAVRLTRTFLRLADEWL
jgi:peptidoglycan LD-endopeptidase CwlK